MTLKVGDVVEITDDFASFKAGQQVEIIANEVNRGFIGSANYPFVLLEEGFEKERWSGVKWYPVNEGDVGKLFEIVRKSGPLEIEEWRL